MDICFSTPANTPSDGTMRHSLCCCQVSHDTAALPLPGVMHPAVVRQTSTAAPFALAPVYVMAFGHVRSRGPPANTTL